MNGLWLDNKLQFRNNIPMPKSASGEALVRVRKAGICATDLELIEGYYPFKGILGHEFVGEITQAHEAPGRVGERVVGEINISCGTCKFCQSGWSNHCLNRQVLGILNRDGAFANYLSLPLSNLVRVPDSVSDDQAVFTEPLAAALEIQQQVTIESGNQVLIIGAGRLGQLIALSLRCIGCRLSVAARYENQQKTLDQAHICWVNEQEIADQSFDFVVEATGSSSGLELASRAIRPLGTIILKSTYQGLAKINLSSIVVNEVTLVGSRCGPFEPALQLLTEGKVDPTPLIDKRFALKDGLSAIEFSKIPGTLKVLLEID